LTEKEHQIFIADNKGRYKIELDAKFKYEITVSYIGILTKFFASRAKFYHCNNNDFKLVPTGGSIKKKSIKHVEYKPIIIKKRYLVYDGKYLPNGNERKKLKKEQSRKIARRRS
jgi:hypothetical protein